MDESREAGKDRPNVIPWPPILLALSLVAGYALSVYMPVPWPGGLAGGVLQATGAALILAAIMLFASALREFRRANTSFRPDRAATHLITTGPYRLTRNPIYLANVLLLLGIGAAFGIAWYLPIAILNGIGEHRLAVVREEAHLERKFGKAWRDYKRRVRAWI